MGVIHVSSSAEFNSQLQQGRGVFVDFFAEWCGPCKVVAPIIEHLSSQFPDVIFIKVDVDQCQELAQEYGVRAMPTFVGFLNGQKVGEVVGANKDQMMDLINKVDKPQAFSGQGMKLGGSDGAPAAPMDDAAKAREAREARFAASRPQQHRPHFGLCHLYRHLDIWNDCGMPCAIQCRGMVFTVCYSPSLHVNPCCLPHALLSDDDCRAIVG
eukprot:TRINITY_DN12082_c1_g1_i6.p1 TRINITY_DN12082_c1_g1~~TRINITY_DN12082_c1_g1_i6.p1  ORF type:complete len:212 (+),score=17.28 TRINITY_DN12082_c1_g1_i6:220-855(+)